jgi:hypothetical protein
VYAHYNGGQYPFAKSDDLFTNQSISTVIVFNHSPRSLLKVYRKIKFVLFEDAIASHDGAWVAPAWVAPAWVAVHDMHLWC